MAAKTEDQIIAYINSVPADKQTELRELHKRALTIAPEAKLWFLDGKNSEGKVVTNPNIGYGNYTINYADGSSRDFYQVGLSANTTGISVYIMGMKDKNYLKDKYADTLGKASITGYCIKFKSLKNINIDVLEAAMKDGFDTC